jgi:hypothetical protein
MLMAFPVSLPHAFQAGAPRDLFQLPITSAQFNPYRRTTRRRATGSGFLVGAAVPGATSPPVTVLLNWIRGDQ